MLASQIVFTLFIIFFFKFIKTTLNYIGDFRRKKDLKHLPIVPFVGHKFHLTKKRTELYDYFLELSDGFKNEPFWCLWIGTIPIAIIHHCDIVDAFFTTSQHTKKSWQYNLVHPWLGSGLLISEGDKWYSRRRLLTKAYHFEILEKFNEIMNEHADLLIQKFEKLIKDKKKIEIFKESKLCTLDIICETAMGVNLESQKSTNLDYVWCVDKASKLLNDRFNAPWYWADFVYYKTEPGKEFKKCLDVLHNFTKDIILKRDAEFDDLNYESKGKFAFLDILLAAKRNDSDLTFQDIQDEVDTFMFEGHDTTASGLAWTVLLLAEYPTIQENLYREIEKELGNGNKQLTSNDLRKLKYLDCVIKESMRLYPPVPYIGRTITEDCVIGGHKFKKNDPVIIAVCSIHRDGRFFPHPEKFDPDRFLNESELNKHPYCYIPFSAGRRNCIGQKFAMMELKIILTSLVRNSKIKSSKKLNDVVKVAELTLHTIDDVYINLEPRF
uniref:Cytochrome p450 4EC1 n=1 Tax=Brachionus koreanus TaxID=1199090 RepID=W8SGS2_9BILA|nr:cytochrome p450 4EC1 [Brachionus koreanus]